VYDHTSLEVAANGLTFVAKGKVMVFDGHTAVTGRDQDKDAEILPALSKGDELIRESVEATQHFTQPPPRYSEATLVKTLEKRGIGRPSTYATIISTIQDRGYVLLKERKFFATELGEIVTDQLVACFPKLLESDFTSNMENNLDSIEAGHADWLEVLREYYRLFAADLEAAQEKMTDLKSNPEKAGMDCDKCGQPMVYKLNKRGRFIACSGYPDCKNTISLSNGEPVEKEKPIPTDEKCEKCGAPMVIRTGKRGKFMACSAFPKCKNTVSLDADLKPVRPAKTGIDCDKCGADMVIKYSRRGPFLACSAYPKCRNAKPLPEELREKPKETDVDCPECGKKLVIRKGRRGEFAACSGYPDCRYTGSLEESGIAKEKAEK
jgi:DNA topoisomerase-1